MPDDVEAQCFGHSIFEHAVEAILAVLAASGGCVNLSAVKFTAMLPEAEKPASRRTRPSRVKATA